MKEKENLRQEKKENQDGNATLQIPPYLGKVMMTQMKNKKFQLHLLLRFAS